MFLQAKVYYSMVSFWDTHKSHWLAYFNFFPFFFFYLGAAITLLYFGIFFYIFFNCIHHAVEYQNENFVCLNRCTWLQSSNHFSNALQFCIAVYYCHQWFTNRQPIRPCTTYTGTCVGTPATMITEPHRCITWSPIKWPGPGSALPYVTTDTRCGWDGTSPE